MAKSKDPDEMLQNVAFHQGLHSLLKKTYFQGKTYIYDLKSITCDP